MICSHCKAEIGAGDQRWAGREPEEFWHYACAEIAQLVLQVNPFGFTPEREGDG